MVRIRKATPKDIPSCVKLCRIPEFPYLSKLPAQQAKEYLGEIARKGIFLVAEEGSAIQGMIYGEPMLNSFAWLDGFTVDRNVRSKGIGKALFQSFCDAAKEKGCTKIYLTAPASNRKTLRFYTSQGLERGTALVDFIVNLKE
ncbi:GNAT family N-acetyltransferase [Candidatus Woesearchaeota archaeon]|nr:GNAT family N-acetyltransferase [Candidatus Woesearchaeota archaeon]